MSIYDQMTTQDLLPKGDHLARIESVDLKVSKAGNEYLNIKMKLKSGETMFHNLHFSEKAIAMSLKQLKSLKLLGALPVYGSVADLNADMPNFIRKTMEILMMLEKKKITVNCSGYDDQDRPKLWIKEYSDIINVAIQKDTSPVQAPKNDGFDKNENLPF